MPLLRAAIEAFPPAALRAWCESLGSRRLSARAAGCFRKSSRPRRCCAPGCGGFASRRRLEAPPPMGRLGRDGNLRFDTRRPGVSVAPDAIVLALGGASWPQLGSDGHWAAILAEADVAMSPLRPANCGFITAWSEVLRGFAGHPLKRITSDFRRPQRARRGDDHADGLEGGAVYALSAPLRDAIARDGEAIRHIDLLPDVAVAQARRRGCRRRAASSRCRISCARPRTCRRRRSRLLREAAHGEGARRLRRSKEKTSPA